MAASRRRDVLRRAPLPDMPKSCTHVEGTTMSKNSSRTAGRHFLQIPGADAGAGPHPARDGHAGHRPSRAGVRQARQACLDGIKTIFKTTKPVIIYTATGTGAWEAALVNTLSPGDRVLMVETGQFATLWKTMAVKLGLQAGVHRDRLAHRRRPGRDRGRSCARTRTRRSRRCACCTTRPRPAASRRSPRCARRSTPPGIRRC